MTKIKDIENLDMVLEERTTLGLLDTQYQKAWATADRQMRQAQAILAEHGDADGNIENDALFQQYRSHMDASRTAMANAKAVKKMFKVHMRSHGELVKVKTEQRTYSKHGQHSYFADIAAVAAGRQAGTAYDNAKERQVRYAKELATEIRNGSPEGQAALVACREAFRVPDGARTAAVITAERMREVRAGSTTTSISGFVTPVWLQSEAVLYRSPTDTFTREAHVVDLPSFGMEVDFGAFTSGTSVGQQTENDGVDNAVPTGANIGPVPVETFAGQVTISQQLFDRGNSPGLPGGSYDAWLCQQMTQALNASVDQYVIAQAVANAQSVTEGSTLTTALWWQNVATAREKLADDAGVRFPGTHVFTTTDLGNFLLKQVDDDHRPIFTVDSGALLAASPIGDPTNANGWTGLHFVGLAAYTDDSLPFGNAPTNTYQQAIVAQMPEVLVAKSPQPITFSYVETEAIDLSVVVGLRTYAASTPRYAGAVVTITGSGYANLS